MPQKPFKHQPLKKPRSLLRNYRSLWISLTVLSALSAALLFSLWSLSLFNQLELITTQRLLRHPAQFFSDVTFLRTGMPLSAGNLIARLQGRGYFPSPEAPPKEGQYRRDGEQGLEVFFRPFLFPDGRTIAGPYRFTFDGEVLGRIARLPDDAVVDDLPLEPVLLGDFSRDGVENRPWITLDRIPETLKRGVLVSEDRRFFSHHGIDFSSLVRAGITNLKRKGVYQGGSTLTQQLVKNAFLTQERTFRRKTTEAFLSLAMEFRYRKEAILEMYLNQIYLGENGTRGVYGVEDASLSYFGKHVSELSRAECALLIGIIPAPNANNPRSSPQRALLRRNRVLEMLLKNTVLAPEEYRAALQEEPALAPLASKGTGDYYITRVRELLEQEFGGPVLDFQGYRIYTTMDFEMQRSAEKALAGQEMEGALVALEPGTGFVRALAGGRGFARSPFNRAVFALRSPGSAFKPIVYAAALEAGSVTLATPLEDKPLTVVQEGGVWEPQNYDGIFHGTATARDALVFSMNIPAVEVFQRAGAEKVIALARALGIRSELSPVPSLALGASGVTPLEMTASYAAFANGGYAVKPTFIRRVADAKGKIVKEYPPERTRALSPGTASLITSALEDVVNRGTASGIRALGFLAPCAGKTGTSDQYHDAWFVGYTPELLCGVWLGHDRPRSLGRTSASLALPVWVSFMKEVHDGRALSFEKNTDLAEITVDPASGLRARSGCAQRRKELFIRGTGPARYCPLHQGGIPGFFQRLFGKQKK
ncbi:MAG: PBP1A family penicillin-binding protein [Endomicrobiales bacterium]